MFLEDDKLKVEYKQLYPLFDNRLFRQLEREITYEERDQIIKIFGRTVRIPRNQSAYGDFGVKYTYSNVTIPAKPWTPLLEKIRDDVTHMTGHTYNFVLLNRYNDESQYVSFHCDDEREIATDVPIVSVSFGQTRNIVFKCKTSGKTHELPLSNGTLMSMDHETNQNWYHSIPKGKFRMSVRLSLTFRKIN